MEIALHVGNSHHSIDTFCYRCKSERPVHKNIHQPAGPPFAGTSICLLGVMARYGDVGRWSTKFGNSDGEMGLWRTGVCLPGGAADMGPMDGLIARPGVIGPFSWSTAILPLACVSVSTTQYSNAVSLLSVSPRGNFRWRMRTSL